MFKWLLNITIIIFFISSAKTQVNIDSTSKEINRNWELNITIYGGFSILVNGNDIQNGMSTSGFNETAEAGWFHGPTFYPYTSRPPILGADVTYYYNKRMGVSLEYALINNLLIAGLGEYNKLTLSSKVYEYSLCYLYSTLNKRNSFFAGPALAIHKVSDVTSVSPILDNSEHISPNQKTMRFGINIGYQTQFIQRDKIYFGLRINYRYVAKSEVGPFIITWVDESNITYTETYNKIKPNMNCVNLMLSFGLRTYKAQ